MPIKIYCQGKIVPQNEARISANDHGFLYGASLFETFRTYGGAPFLLNAHIARLLEGCRSYGIQTNPSSNLLIGSPPDFSALRQTIQDLLAKNTLNDAVFRYTLSAGEAPLGLPGAPFETPTEILFIRPLPPPATDPSINIHILDTVRTEPEVFPRPKSGQYMNCIVALRELRQRAANPGDEGLLLTREGLLSEGVTSNLFLVSGDTLLTPSEKAHILPGITRKYVLEKAAALGITTATPELRLPNLLHADALFITNSVRGIVPVHQVLDRTTKTLWQKNSTANPIVQKLLTTLSPLTRTRERTDSPARRDQQN